MHKFYIYADGRVVLGEMSTAEQNEINAAIAPAIEETDGSEDDSDDYLAEVEETFSLLPAVEELNDNSENISWKLRMILFEQEQKAKGNYKAQIGKAHVTYCNNEIVEIKEQGWAYKKIKGKRMYFIYSDLRSRKDFFDFILWAAANDLQKEHQAIIKAAIETDGTEDDADETFTAIIPTEDNDYEETNEPEILNADLFVNLYHSPSAEEFSSTTRTINGEVLHFFHHKLTHISAPALNLEVYFDNGRGVYLNGRMEFWHGDKPIARDKVWQVPIIKETAKAQKESFSKFFAGDHEPKFFKVNVYATFADGQEHNYVKYFDYFNQAQKFVEDTKNFIGDVQSLISIKANKQGGACYYIRFDNGSEHYTLPTVDAAEAQSRIDDLNKAIADNESFAGDEETASLLRVANYRNKQTIDYYEAALRMTEPTNDKPTKELKRRMAEITKERNEIYDALEEAETDDEISQEWIDYLEDELATLLDEYHKLWAQLDAKEVMIA